MTRCFVLSAPDQEMDCVESLLTNCEALYVYARTIKGKRANAGSSLTERFHLFL
jgi:hypothetical protein